MVPELLTGKKRFPGFSGEWEKLHFSDIAILGKKKFDPKAEKEVLECVELEHISQSTSILLGTTTTEISISTKSVFNKGSLLFGKLRPYLRKYWLADRDGVCSSEIWVLNANNKKTIPEYLHYLVQMDFFINAANVASGTHMPRADWNVVKDLIVSLPSIKEQKKIAQILSTWDKAITTTEQLLTNSQQQKKALMQQLLTGKKRLLDKNGVRFSGEWKRVELGSLLDYKQPTPYLVESTDYNDAYDIPVLTAGKTFVLGYTNEDFGIYREDFPAIIFDDFTTDSKFVDFPFKAKSSAMKILSAKKGVLIKYVFEAMQMLNFSVGGHQRHWISIYSNLVIPVPEKEEQQKIATVLSLADREITALQQQLDCLKQEKKALMQQLLTGKRRVTV